LYAGSRTYSTPSSRSTYESSSSSSSSAIAFATSVASELAPSGPAGFTFFLLMPFTVLRPRTRPFSSVTEKRLTAESAPCPLTLAFRDRAPDDSAVPWPDASSSASCFSWLGLLCIDEKMPAIASLVDAGRAGGGGGGEGRLGGGGGGSGASEKLGTGPPAEAVDGTLGDKVANELPSTEELRCRLIFGRPSAVC
jgi:hypothetical protein